MKGPKSNNGLIIAVIYLLLVAAAAIFAVTTLNKSAFAGVYLVLLTVPWSIISTILLDILHIQDSVPVSVKFYIFFFEASINASILYFIVGLLKKTKKENGSRLK